MKGLTGGPIEERKRQMTFKNVFGGGKMLHFFKNVIVHKNSFQVFNRFNIHFLIL